jgi:predicted phosphodiesterase
VAELEQALDKVAFIAQEHGRAIASLAADQNAPTPPPVTPAREVGDLRFANGRVERWDGSLWVFQELSETPPPVSFLTTIGVSGDAGETSAAATKFALRYSQENVDAIILAGDCNYGLPSEITARNVAWAPFVAAGKCITCEGNHDLDHDGGVAHRQYFTRPTGSSPSPSHLPGCYVTRLPGVAVITLQSGKNTAWVQTVAGGVGIGSPMHQWFLSQLATIEEKWIIVNFHHPAFSPFGGSREHVADLDWPWDSYGVHAVINGHAHASAVCWKDGVCYLNASAVGNIDGRIALSMQGGGGRAWAEWLDTGNASSLILRATPDRLSYEFRNFDDAVNYAGDCMHPKTTPFTWDADVWAPTEAITGSRYVAHAPCTFELESIAVFPGTSDAEIPIEIRIDDVPAFLMNGGFDVQHEQRMVLFRQKITAHAAGDYGGGPVSGLRLAINGRRIAGAQVD